MVLLGHVYNKALRWGVATTNPVRGMERFERKPKRPPVPLAIDLAVCLGTRRGDLLTLKRSNLTDEGIFFTQRKTERAQLIVWSDDLREIVARCKALKPQIPGEYLIRTRTGKLYSKAGLSANWQRLMAKHVATGG